MFKDKKEAVVSAANTITFLAQLIHGIESGKRNDLIHINFKNAKDHFESLLMLHDENVKTKNNNNTKLKEYIMENSAFKCTEFECKRSGVKLQKIEIVHLPYATEYKLIDSDDIDYVIPKAVFEIIKKLMA